MTSIVPQDFNFLSTTIRPDGLVNATALTTAYRNTTGVRKDVKNWLATKEAKDSVAYLGRVTGIPVTDLVIVEPKVGTWLHPDLAEILAQWISVEYRFAVVALIRQAKEQGQVQAAAPKPLLLEQSEACAQHIASIQHILGGTNPRLAQILIDVGVNDFVDQHQAKQLQPEFPADQWFGLVQIADKMGIKTNASTRVKLGQHIAKLLPSLGLERVQERRLCNGQMQEIWCYRDDNVIRDAIADWAAHAID